MNSHQAKEILTLYRPGTADGDDPEIREALAQTRTDAELADWFEQHCDLQSAIRAKFREIAVPDGLKQQILSERKAHSIFASRRSTVVAALAFAGVVVLAGVATLLVRPRVDDSFANFQLRLAGSAVRSYPKMDLLTTNLTEIQTYLAANHGLADYALPTPLASTPGTGCKVLSWHGRPVSMVCFNSGANPNPQAADLFLFIIERSKVRQPPASEVPQFTRLSPSLVVAGWTKGDKAYVLAGTGDEAFLRRFL